MLLICLLIVQLATSQNGSNKYPKILKIEQDTVVAFTKLQAKKLDLYRVDFENCLEISDSLRANLNRADYLIEQQQKLNNELRLGLTKSEQLNSLNNEIINKQSADLTKYYKQANRRGTMIKFLGGGLVVSLGTILLLTLN